MDGEDFALDRVSKPCISFVCFLSFFLLPFPPFFSPSSLFSHWIFYITPLFLPIT